MHPRDTAHPHQETILHMVLAGSQEYITTLLIRRFGQSWPEIPKIPPGNNAASKGSMEREQGKIAHPMPRVKV